MCLGHYQIGIVDPTHTFLAIEFHRVFLHTDGSLLQSAVHLRVKGHGVGFGAIIIHSQHLGVIVLDVLLQLIVTFLKTILSIPIHVVMASQVVEDTTRKGVLFGGTTDQKQHQGR